MRGEYCTHQNRRDDGKTVTKFVPAPSDLRTVANSRAGNVYALRLRTVDRATDLSNRPQPKVNVIQCPMCRAVVPTEQLTYFSGRKMCRNCIAGWFDDDDSENDDKRDAS